MKGKTFEKPCCFPKTEQLRRVLRYTVNCAALFGRAPADDADEEGWLSETPGAKKVPTVPKEARKHPSNQHPFLSQSPNPFNPLPRHLHKGGAP